MNFGLLTFNTLFRGDSRARIELLAGILEDSPYDVVCLQEVVSPVNLTVLRRATPSYPHAAHGTSFPLVRGGLVTLSRRPIVRRHFHTYRFTGRPRAEGLLRKGALLTRVAFGDGHVTIANTHLTANRDNDWDLANPYTRIEAGELAELAELLAHPRLTDPLIVAGDLNVPRSSPVLRDFRVATGLVDVLDGDPATTFRPTPKLSLEPIDQILASPSLTATTSLVFKEEVRLPDGRPTYLSDHYGIAAAFSV
ncbi:endonuclease/exonuclease/phosphatase family protein [Actinomadura verrucosospora]|uniref:Endonuclease/exonuclease/phosphatase n=1 Tax=Actinomadura verrucosospora TaxID=46165 RepID=A0A7D3VV99_ACTVE|nr:endonuclease/exonuclease/phosphatase family protein [Actinomadura verrucosospora]QKG23993.1 endonuclease/exonuclease/phosphatase [Actinomadura verrucosospora]